MTMLSPAVDQLIQALPDWQQRICLRARELIHAADPRISEEIKFTNRAYFVLSGNICAFLPTKNHVNIFIYDPMLEDPHGIINQGHSNKTAQAIQISKDSFPDESAFVDLIKQVVSHNQQGGWRHMK